MQESLTKQEPITGTSILSEQFLRENEEKWCAFFWINLNLTPDELAYMEESWKKMTILDGFSAEDRMCCFKFQVHRPKYSTQLNYCKEMNRKTGVKRLRDLAEVSRKFGYYLNVNKLFLTKNGAH